MKSAFNMKNVSKAMFVIFLNSEAPGSPGPYLLYETNVTTQEIWGNIWKTHSGENSQNI